MNSQDVIQLLWFYVLSFTDSVENNSIYLIVPIILLISEKCHNDGDLLVKCESVAPFRCLIRFLVRVVFRDTFQSHRQQTCGENQPSLTGERNQISVTWFNAENDIYVQTVIKLLWKLNFMERLITTLRFHVSLCLQYWINTVSSCPLSLHLRLRVRMNTLNYFFKHLASPETKTSPCFSTRAASSLPSTFGVTTGTVRWAPYVSFFMLLNIWHEVFRLFS